MESIGDGGGARLALPLMTASRWNASLPLQGGALPRTPSARIHFEATALPPKDANGFGKRVAASVGATAASSQTPRLMARRLAAIPSGTTQVGPSPSDAVEGTHEPVPQFANAPTLAPRPAPSAVPAALQEHDSEAAGTLGGRVQAFLTRMKDTLEALQELGPMGQAITVVGFSIWVCFALPITPVEIAFGYIYGALWGFIFGLFCKATGSCAAFVLGKRLGRRFGVKVPSVLRPRLALLQTRPVLAMVGIRLMPIPLAVKNYGLGVCEVTLYHFFLATMAVDIPISMLWATAGASCRSLSEAFNFTHGESPGAVMVRFVLTRVIPSVFLLAVIVYIFWRRVRPSMPATTELCESNDCEEGFMLGCTLRPARASSPPPRPFSDTESCGESVKYLKAQGDGAGSVVARSAFGLPRRI
eukprot:TRINITY_DN27389_c0_g2_i1.p1 TRINITY_DN27389_c0_g2~~TRINITY_DN27389_c0_g2_i1.p1  ORF type:complete len:416 (+),score=43.20 TRINITY_DN27389_c0_g2_i1:62-1309(+)